MNIQVFADDLTGANATAIRLAYAGFHAVVHLTEPLKLLPKEFDSNGHNSSSTNALSVLGVSSVSSVSKHLDEAHVFNTGSRNMSCTDAVHVLQKYLEPIHMTKDMVSLRIDSTLRGPIAASIDFLLATWPDKIAFVVPAYPSSGRTTKDGIHYVGGIPVHETPAGNDRFSPVRSSDLRVLIGRCSVHSSGCLDLQTVRCGEKAMLDRLFELVESGVRIVLCDAETDEDINSLAHAAASLRRCRTELDILPVDPGPFTSILAELERNAANGVHGNPAVFGVSASIMHNARVQMDYLERDRNVCVFRYTGQAPAEVVQTLRSMTISRPSARALFLRTDMWDLTEPEALLVVKKLPLIVQAVVRAFPSVFGLYFSGGESAQAILAGAGVTSLAMVEELAPLTTLSRPLDGGFVGKWIVTKGGAIGDEAAVSRAISKLHEKIVLCGSSIPNMPEQTAGVKENMI
jgi:D-threonate/D-erythronate kinase